ncbi:hypothetical protein I315_03594 [Cryptococcus gattii Ru294]|nr:hypothetical protein I315_03594 [Cryptococcus gattii Ru294]
MVEEYLEVPGTARIYALDGEGGQGGNTNSLEITLIPTPSKDPNDPLNWSKGRKYLMLACVALYVVKCTQDNMILTSRQPRYTISVTILSSDLYSVFDPLSASTGLSLDQLNVGTGYLYLFIGISTLISQPCSMAFGKKSTYLVSAFGAALVNLWTAFARGNGQWIASRLLLGFFISPSFTLVEVSVADVFFLHERSFPIGLYFVVLFMGVSLGPILSGYIYEGIGWKAIIVSLPVYGLPHEWPLIYPQWLSTGLMVIVGFVLFFFLEETSFQREHLTNVNEESNESVTSIGLSPPQGCTAAQALSSIAIENSNVENPDKKGSLADTTTYYVEPTITTITSFASTPWPGPKFWKYTRPHKHAAGILMRGLVQPILLLRLPLIWWSGLMFATYQICFNR